MSPRAHEIDLAPIQELLRRTLRGGPLLGALINLRERHPEASLELAALEVALASATRELESRIGAAVRAAAQGEARITEDAA